MLGGVWGWVGCLQWNPVEVGVRCGVSRGGDGKAFSDGDGVLVVHFIFSLFSESISLM